MKRKYYQSHYTKSATHRLRREREAREYAAIKKQMETDPENSEYYRRITGNSDMEIS